MPEVSNDASILIAISYQALNRAINENPDTILCDSVVCILFASFFIEANLNSILNQSDLSEERSLFYRKSYPGLGEKLGCFYYKFISNSIVKSNKKDYVEDYIHVLDDKFPGFKQIYDFRNNLSHGIVDDIANCYTLTNNIRANSKSIVDSLYTILNENSISIARDVTYETAINKLSNS